MCEYVFKHTDLIDALPEFQFTESSTIRAAKVINTSLFEKALANAGAEDFKRLALDEIRNQFYAFYDAEMIAGLLVSQLRKRLGSDAISAMLDARMQLDGIVRAKSGLSSTVCSIVNRAGFECQVAVLEDSLGWPETKRQLEKILGIEIHPLFE